MRTQLTPRETQVLNCVVQGMSRKEIGRVLKMGPATADGHVRKLLLKTGAETTLKLVVAYYKNGGIL